LGEDWAEFDEVRVGLGEVWAELGWERVALEEVAAAGDSADGAEPEASRIAPKRGQVLYSGSEGS